MVKCLCVLDILLLPWVSWELRYLVEVDAPRLEMVVLFGLLARLSRLKSDVRVVCCSLHHWINHVESANVEMAFVLLRVVWPNIDVGQIIGVFLLLAFCVRRLVKRLLWLRLFVREHEVHICSGVVVFTGCCPLLLVKLIHQLTSRQSV